MYRLRKTATVQPQKIIQSEPIDYCAHFQALGLPPNVVADFDKIIKTDLDKFSKIFEEVVEQKLSGEGNPIPVNFLVSVKVR